MNHDDPEDRIAAQAEAFDQALITGEGSESGSSLSEDPEALAAYMAARASLQMLERVWPRCGSSGSPATEIRIADAPIGCIRPIPDRPRAGVGGPSGSFSWRSTPT